MLIEGVGGLEWAALRKTKLRFRRPDVLLSSTRSSVDGGGVLRPSLLEDTTAERSDPAVRLMERFNIQSCSRGDEDADSGLSH